MKPKIERKNKYIMDNLSLVSHDLGFAGFILENLRFFGSTSAESKGPNHQTRVFGIGGKVSRMFKFGSPQVWRISRLGSKCWQCHGFRGVSRCSLASWVSEWTQGTWCCLTVMNFSDLDFNLPWDWMDNSPWIFVKRGKSNCLMHHCCKNHLT